MQLIDTYFIVPGSVSVSMIGQGSSDHRALVSVMSGTKIKLSANLDKDILYANNLSFRTWSVVGSNTRFSFDYMYGSTHEHPYALRVPIYIYIRVDASRSGSTGQLIFSPYEYTIGGKVFTTKTGDDLYNNITKEDTSSIYDRDLSIEATLASQNGTAFTPSTSVRLYAPANATSDGSYVKNYFYVRIGKIQYKADSNTDEVTIETGTLGTDYAYENKSDSELEEMFRFNTDRTAIVPQRPFSALSFLKSGATAFVDRIITAIVDTAEKAAAWADDHGLATTSSIASYVAYQISTLDSRFLRKDQDDETPYTLTMGNAIVGTTTTVIQKDDEGNDVEVTIPIGGDLTVKGDADIDGDTTIDGKVVVSLIESHDTTNTPIVMKSTVDIEQALVVDKIDSHPTVGNISINGTTLIDKFGGIKHKDFLPDIIKGQKWQIDSNGEAEMQSLILRSFLEVPELRYNRVTVESGTTWNAPGAGLIKRVGKDTDNYFDLKLEPSEVGSFVEGDICMGIWHFRNEDIDDVNNASGVANYYSDNASLADEEADTSGLTVSGFCRVEFKVLRVDDYTDTESVIDSATGQPITITNTYTNGRVYFEYKAQHKGAVQPQMTIVAYGNCEMKTEPLYDEDNNVIGTQEVNKYPNRTRSWYATKKFQRYIYNMDGNTNCILRDEYGKYVKYSELTTQQIAQTKADGTTPYYTVNSDGYACFDYKDDMYIISFPWNVAMHLGDTKDMSVTEKDGSVVNMGDYSAFLSNVYFYGIQQKINIDQIEDADKLKGNNAIMYTLGLSATLVHISESAVVLSPVGNLTWNAQQINGYERTSLPDGIRVYVRYNTSSGTGTWYGAMSSATITHASLVNYSSIDFAIADKSPASADAKIYASEVVTYVVDGSSSTGLIADLTNEMSAIAVDSDNTPTSAVSVSTTAHLYYGSDLILSRLTIARAVIIQLLSQGIHVKDNDTEIVISGNRVTVVDATSHQLSVYIEGIDDEDDDGNPIVTYRPLESSDNIEIPINLSSQDTSITGERQVVFSIVPLLPGADGKSPMIYELEPSMSAVVFTRDEDGELVDPSLLYSKLSIMLRTANGDGQSVIDLTSDYAVYYKFDGIPTEISKGTLYTAPITITTDLADYSSINFALFYEGMLIDRESVPFIRDGAKGATGIGQTGAILRGRGPLVLSTAVTYVNNDEWVDWVIVGKTKWRLADGVESWTYSASGIGHVYPTTTTTASSVKYNGQDVWVRFSEMGDIATGFILADSIDASSTTTGEAFIGETSGGVTVDAQGNVLVNGTANGWLINGGTIRHTVTGLTLTSDGYLYDPNGLHFKVGSDTLLGKLTQTGIDITNGKITLTADNLLCLNNDNEKTMSLNQYGDLTISGVLNNYIQEIDMLNDINTRLVIADDGMGHMTDIPTAIRPVNLNEIASLDALQLGGVVKLTKITKHLILPFYITEAHSCRTLTNYGDSIHYITREELRRLIGKKITFIFEPYDTPADVRLYVGSTVYGSSYLNKNNIVRGENLILLGNDGNGNYLDNDWSVYKPEYGGSLTVEFCIGTLINGGLQDQQVDPSTIDLDFPPIAEAYYWKASYHPACTLDEDSAWDD